VHKDWLRRVKKWAGAFSSGLGFAVGADEVSRFQSAVHNIGHHAVSGLSDFLQEAYAACEAEGVWALRVDLLSGTCVQREFDCCESLRGAVGTLKRKYEQILTDTSGVGLDDVGQAVVDVDFLVNDRRYEDRKRALSDAGVWYGHDPIYRLTVTVQLKNGHVYQETFRDS